MAIITNPGGSQTANTSNVEFFQDTGNICLPNPSAVTALNFPSGTLTVGGSSVIAGGNQSLLVNSASGSSQTLTSTLTALTLSSTLISLTIAQAGLYLISGNCGFSFQGATYASLGQSLELGILANSSVISGSIGHLPITVITTASFFAGTLDTGNVTRTCAVGDVITLAAAVTNPPSAGSVQAYIGYYTNDPGAFLSALRIG